MNEYNSSMNSLKYENKKAMQIQNANYSFQINGNEKASKEKEENEKK